MEKSNLCPICRISFYKNETYLNKIIKEAILYVTNIIDLINENEIVEEKPNDRSESSSLPDINILFDENEIDEASKQQSNCEEKEKLVVLPPKISKENIFIKPTCNVPKSTSVKTRTKSTSRSKAIKIENQVEEAEASQRPRSQSVKKNSKKNDKGEQPLHLAVMDVMNNFY